MPIVNLEFRKAKHKKPDYIQKLEQLEQIGIEYDLKRKLLAEKKKQRSLG